MVAHGTGITWLRQLIARCKRMRFKFHCQEASSCMFSGNQVYIYIQRGHEV